MVTDNMKSKLITLIRDKCGDDVSRTLSYLWQLGLLDEKTAMRYVVRSDYYAELKSATRSCFEIKIDIANKYDIELDFVNNAIYKYTHLTI